MKPATAIRRLLTLLEEYEWQDQDRQALRLAIDSMLDKVEEVHERVRIVERYVPRPYWPYWGYDTTTYKWEPATWVSRPTDGSGTFTVSGTAPQLPAGTDRSSFIGSGTTNAT